MADYGSIALPECWGIDTALAGALTDAQIQALASARLPNKQLIKFVWGYVPLAGNVASKWDMSADRLRAYCDAGFCVLLVQHCRSGLWTPSGEQGLLDGARAGSYAKDIGYQPDCHLAMDDEAVAVAGAAMFSHATAWCGPQGVRLGAQPVVYEGYEPGLTAEQEYEIPDVDRYWGAYGPWDVARRSVCCRQSLQISVAGIGVDPDHAAPDKLGGVLRAMCRLDLAPARLAAA
jgi:hypothetical protein